jgi:hypothetical protein
VAKTEEPKTAPRDYVVLKRTGPIECQVQGIFQATSAGRAIDQARNGEGGRWVAVPVRNWGEEDLTVVQREPTVARQKLHPGQQSIPVEPEPVKGE